MDPKLEIAIVIETLGHGGAERLILDTARHIDRDRFSLHVYTLFPWDFDLRGELEKVAATVSCLGMESRRALPRGVGRLCASLRERRPSAIHTHLFTADIVGRLAAVRLGLPVASTLHGVDFEPAARLGYPRFHRWKQLLAAAFETLTVRIARARLIAVSDCVAESAAVRLGVRRSQIVVIRNGVDTDRFRPDPGVRAAIRASLGIGPEVPVIAAIGRLTPEKNHETLLRAAPRLLARHPSLVLLFAGDGPRRAALHGLSRDLGLSSRVRFLGSVDDVPGLLSAADVLAHPSLHEGFGLVVVEAMASALPVVISRIPALLEIVRDGETGVFCDPADADALASVLDRLLSDDGERARLGAAARRDAVKRFSLQGMVRSLEKEYERMVRAEILSSEARDVSSER